MMITKEIYIEAQKYLLVLETEQAPYRAELYKRSNGEIRYVSQNHFMSLQELNQHLRGWIKSAANHLNKRLILQEIEEWDGVIE